MAGSNDMDLSEAVKAHSGRQVLCRLTKPVFVLIGARKVPLLEGTILPCTHWVKVAGILYAVCMSSLGSLLIDAQTSRYLVARLTPTPLEYEQLRIPEKWAEVAL